MLNALFSLILLWSPLSADANPEYLYAHFSQPFYTGGDIIWSSVYFLELDTSSISSRVIYVDLLSPDGKVLHQERLQRQHNQAEWNYQLPFDIDGGIYTCRFYTLWNLNFDPPVIYEYPFRVLSGPGEGAPAPDYTDWKPSQMVVGSLPMHIEVRPEKEVYKKRETIRVYLEASTGFAEPVTGSFSVAVTDAGWIPPLLATRPTMLTSVNRYKYLSTVNQYQFAPETGLLVTGKVFDKETESAFETSYLSLHLVESNKYLQTATQIGQFQYELEDFYGRQNAQIHNLNPYLPPLPGIELLRPADFLSFDPEIQQEAAQPDTLTMNRYQFLMRKQRKFRELFGQAPFQIPERPKTRVYSGTPDKIYDMSDYQQLESVDEFLDEIVLSARLKGKGDDRNVFLLNDDTYDRFTQPAWFQVDGYLISDAAYALSIPFYSVKEVEVYSTPRTIADHFPSILSAFGVVGINTREENLPAGLEDVSNRFEVLGYHYPQQFSAPPSGAGPDFRPVVFWQANIQTDEQGKAYFEFPASDARGRFIIQVEGVSFEGKAGTGYGSYSVD